MRLPFHCDHRSFSRTIKTRGVRLCGFRKTNRGYILELRFPRETLPFLNFARSSIFGFALLIHHNDGGGREGLLATTSAEAESYKTPILWKAVQLIDQ